MSYIEDNHDNEMHDEYLKKKSKINKQKSDNLSKQKDNSIGEKKSKQTFEK